MLLISTHIKLWYFIILLRLWRVLLKRIIFNKDPRPLSKLCDVAQLQRRFNPRYAAKWRMALGKSSRLDGVEAFIDENQQGKLDGTWKPNNHFTSVPRATLLLFFPWIAGFGSFQTINSCIILCTHPSIVMSLHVRNIILCVCVSQEQMSDLKGDPICILVGYLYCIHPMYIHIIHHFSHILPVPRCGEAMAKAVVAEEHRAWPRSTFVPQPVEQLTLVKSVYWIKGCIWYTLKRNKAKTNGLIITNFT